jgi:hypothetical protein
MTCATQDFVIRKGSTFSKVIRWEASPFITKAITGITKAAPAVVTAVSHDVPDGWRVALTGVQGMTEINAGTYPPRTRDFHKATVLTSSTVEINDIDSSDFSTWTSGGFLVYYTPVNLSGYTARMHIRLTAASTGDPLVTLTTENAGIALDNTAKTITLTIAATATDDLTFTSGVYDLELVSNTDVVYPLLSGRITVEAEVTR